MAALWDMMPCALALMMEAARTSQESLYFYETTGRPIPVGLPLPVRPTIPSTFQGDEK
jgi:hypothetical protein